MKKNRLHINFYHRPDGVYKRFSDSLDKFEIVFVDYVAPIGLNAEAFLECLKD